MKYTKNQLKKRFVAIEDALANLRLEGLEPDAEVIEASHLEAYGEITMEEVRQKILARPTAK